MFSEKGRTVDWGHLQTKRERRPFQGEENRRGCNRIFPGGRRGRSWEKQLLEKGGVFSMKEWLGMGEKNLWCFKSSKCPERNLLKRSD